MSSQQQPQRRQQRRQHVVVVDVESDPDDHGRGSVDVDHGSVDDHLSDGGKSISAATITELNSQGIQHLREGRRQDALNCMQESAAFLLKYVSLKSPITSAAVESTNRNKDCVNDGSGHSCSNNKKQRIHGKDSVCGCKHKEEASTSPEAPPLKKRKTVQEDDASKKEEQAQSQIQPARPQPQPPQTTDTIAIGPEVDRIISQPQQKPSAVVIPFGTPSSTLDKIPEQNESLFNQVLALPQLEEIKPRQYDMLYASLLYNMAVVLHNHGLQYSCGASLTKALETYEVAHCVLLHDLYLNKADNQNEGNTNNDEQEFDVHHFLLYALWNNMSNIYSYACSSSMTKYCLDRLRIALSYTDSSMLRREDLLFYIVNLDVMGDGGIITAASSA